MARDEESPNRSLVEYLAVSDGGEEVGLEFGGFRLDIEGLAFDSQFNPAPKRPVVQTWETLYAMEEKGSLRPRRSCQTCENWDHQPAGWNSHRPPGPINRDACNGCILSHLDATGPDKSKLKDELFTDYAEAMERVNYLDATQLQAQSPAEKKRWVAKKQKALAYLRETEEACRLAGMSVGGRKPNPIRHQGDAPLASLHAPVVSADLRACRR